MLHAVVELWTSRCAVTWKHFLVRQFLIGVESGRPAVECALSEECVDVIVNKILREKNSVFGKPNHQSVLGLGVL